MVIDAAGTSMNQKSFVSKQFEVHNAHSMKTYLRDILGYYKNHIFR